MSPRLAGLDGLRGLAALCVLAFHVWLYRDGTPARVAEGDWVDGTLSSLRIALVLFFVLSGFLLASDLRRWLDHGVGGSIGGYALRRAARILPAYWLSLVGALALLWGGSAADGIRMPDPEHLWLFAVLGQNYSPETVMALNPVTWTLCVEVAFYALLPLVALLLRALGRHGVPIAAVVLIAAALAANAAADDHAWELTARKSPLPYLGYFGLGIGVAWLAGRRRLGAAPTLALAAAGLAGAGVWAWYQLAVELPSQNRAIGVLQHLPAAVGFALLIWAAARGSGPLARALSLRPLTALGRVSYGVYLWHLPILLFLNRVADLSPIVLGLATFALTLPAAVLSWRALEKPALALGRGVSADSPGRLTRRAAPV